MRQRLLTQLVQVPTDLDYVESFQQLARTNLEIRRDGPNAQLLLRLAELERAVGNHGASLKACQDALVLADQNPEMHYQLGVAYLFLCLAKADILPVGPNRVEAPRESLAELLDKAAAAFQGALKLNPQDQDAREDLKAVKDLIRHHETDQQLADAVRGQKS
jgi:tetratricopeptide (TPR) repeat protein